MSDAAEPKLSRWDRLSTGVKMLIILSIGLLPLGVIAVAASIDNARASRARSQVEAQALLAIYSQRFITTLSRNSFTIRAARVRHSTLGRRHLRAHLRQARLAARRAAPATPCSVGRSRSRQPGSRLPTPPPARCQLGGPCSPPAI